MAIYKTSCSTRNNNTLTLSGSPPFILENTVWDDIRILPGEFQRPGVSDPNITTWQPGGGGTTFRVYEFNTNDEVYTSIQMPHGWKIGTNLHPHVHWTPRDKAVAESGNTVAWKIDYTVSSIGGVFISSATIDMTGTCSGVNDKHEYAEVEGEEINMSGITGVSAMLYIKLYRDADTWATNTAGNRPVFLEFDLHFESDTLGSDNETTK